MVHHQVLLPLLKGTDLLASEQVYLQCSEAHVVYMSVPGCTWPGDLWYSTCCVLLGARVYLAYRYRSMVQHMLCTRRCQGVLGPYVYCAVHVKYLQMPGCTWPICLWCSTCCVLVGAWVYFACISVVQHMLCTYSCQDVLVL